jgi:hypothetical protein
MTPTDTHLLAWLADALEPGDAQALAAHVAADPVLQVRLRQLRAKLDARARPRAWQIPPPGIAGGQRPVQVSAHHAPVMGATRPRVGDRFRLRIDTQAAPTSVVVVLRHEQHWSVVTPTAPGEIFRVEQLPHDEGGWWVDLLAPAPAGRQRWAVALIPAAQVSQTLPTRWEGDEPWATLQQAIAAGTVSVSATEVDVLGR